MILYIYFTFFKKKKKKFDIYIYNYNVSYVSYAAYLEKYFNNNNILTLCFFYFFLYIASYFRHDIRHQFIKETFTNKTICT
jgi:hypothetical protein